MKASSVKTDWKAPSSAGWQGRWARFRRWKLSDSAVLCYLLATHSWLPFPFWHLCHPGYCLTSLLPVSWSTFCLSPSSVAVCGALFANTPAVSPCLSSFPLIFLFSFFLFTVDSLQGLRFSARTGGLSVWTLIVLSMPAWVLLVHSGFPPRCRDNIVRLTRDSESSLRCGCERACLSLRIRPAIDWQLVLARLCHMTPGTGSTPPPTLSAGQAVMENGWMGVLMPSGFHILTFLEWFSALSATHQYLFLYLSWRRWCRAFMRFMPVWISGFVHFGLFDC